MEIAKVVEETTAPPVGDVNPAAAAAPPPPPLQKRRRRCDCETAEACFACGRCMEQHCLCGAALDLGDQSLCRESRACNCRVLEPTMRCARCFGCQQTHCRCAQHQEQARLLVQGRRMRTRGGGAIRCKCFPRKGTNAAKQAASQIHERRKRLGAIRRRIGIPSSAGLYRRKVQSADVVVDENGENALDASDASEGEVNAMSKPMRATAVEELEGTIPPLFLERARLSRDAVGARGHAPQQLLKWSRSKSYQESIEPLDTVQYAKMDMTDVIIDRAVDNAIFAQDREAAKPSEDMVDYLISLASVKTSRLPELIGTLDDTAAVAVGIVLEEYTNQLVHTSERHEPLCLRSKQCLQDFVAMVLDGFSYTTYLEKRSLPPLLHLSGQQPAQVVEELAELVVGEFLVVQQDRWISPQQQVQLCSHVYEMVMADLQAVVAMARTTGGGSGCSGGLATATEVKSPSPQQQQTIKSITLSQRTSKLTGHLVYKYDLEADIGAHHRATVVVDGLETQQAAEQSIERMKRVVSAQQNRLCTLEKPPPAPQDPLIDELYAQLATQINQSKKSPKSRRQ